MADSSFDVVSKLDRQEVDNAVNQTAKEIANRYDFRGVDAAITLSGDTIAMEANSASRVMAILDDDCESVPWGVSHARVVHAPADGRAHRAPGEDCGLLRHRDEGGRPVETGRPPLLSQRSAVVHELERDVQLLALGALQQGDDGLQVVAGL